MEFGEKVSTAIHKSIERYREYLSQANERTRKELYQAMVNQQMIMYNNSLGMALNVFTQALASCYTAIHARLMSPPDNYLVAPPIRFGSSGAFYLFRFYIHPSSVQTPQSITRILQAEVYNACALNQMPRLRIKVTLGKPVASCVLVQARWE